MTQGRARARRKPGAARACGEPGAQDFLPRALVLQRLAAADARRGAELRASPAGRHVARDARDGPASGAAAPRVRGAARAPAGAAAAQGSESSGAGAAAGRLAADSRNASSPRCRSRSPARSSACSTRWNADLARERPMVRLIQGDVGCGKTVVAAAAAARAVGSGRQAALMAPTELLAEQHLRSLEAWFRPLGVTVALLSGSQPARTRRSALAAVASGEVHDRGRHACAVPGRREFPGPRARHRRRAAPLRRAAAPAAEGEGPASGTRIRTS